MCRLCLKLRRWCIHDEGDFDPEVMATFFKTDIHKKVILPPYSCEVPMYNVLFGFYQGYFKYNSDPNGDKFHTALVNGNLHEFIMKFYDDKSSGYLTAVRQNNLNLNQISNGEMARCINLVKI